MFENILNMVIDVKGKAKVNIKDRMYIPLFCHHKIIELVYDESRIVKSKTNFILDNNEQLLVYH